MQYAPHNCSDGEPVYSAGNGRVISAGYSPGYGRTVHIRHGGGYSTLYAHMSRTLVRKGETVRIGQRIGKVGSTGMSTGNHLHFELQKNGRLLDPVEWFGRRF